MDDSILIVGSGAMACLFASRLSAAGVHVTMLGSWAEGLQALRSHGVRVAEGGGGEKAFAVEATSRPSDCSGARLALVLVKSWQTERAARQLAECLEADGVALTLQNGLGNREALDRELGENRVVLGVTTSGATLLGPGRVRPAGEGTISLGEHSRLSEMTPLLRRAGFEVEIVGDADDLLWGKLVINAAINPLTALLGCPNGELVTRPAARQLMAAAATEASAVAQRLGHTLAYADPAEAAERVARRTAENHSSMLQDVRRGAPTEIDAICGAIVAAAEESGVATPVNRTLWLLIRALIQRGVGT
ncbi:MAG: 2-dehydropantoate 2-reductase [Anaerolineales bacterium]|nr:MAG: 2-dehydropantoate 2-reductase [Anaerolineales bacterium]